MKCDSCDKKFFIGDRFVVVTCQNCNGLHCLCVACEDEEKLKGFLRPQGTKIDDDLSDDTINMMQ